MGESVEVRSVKEVNECNGCGIRKEDIKMIYLPYATSLFYLCSNCRIELSNKLK